MVIAEDHGGEWDATLARVASWGCNAASIYNYPKHAQSWYEELYAAADKYSIKLFPWMKSEMAYGDWQPGHIEWAAKQSALGGWYAFEEPNITEDPGSEEYLTNKYAAIKSRDPNHIVWGCYSMQSTFANWVPEAMDMVCGVCYHGYYADKLNRMKELNWYNAVRNLNKPLLGMIAGWNTSEKVMRDAVRYWQDIAPNFVAIGYFRYATIQPYISIVTNINVEYGAEFFTAKTTTHACEAKISYQVSSIAAKNVALTCPYDGLALGVKGIKETVTIANIDEMMAKLQGEIATLDNRIVELEAEIEAFRAERDRVREILGV